jgi:hypothetical protein
MKVSPRILIREYSPTIHCHSGPGRIRTTERRLSGMISKVGLEGYPFEVAKPEEIFSFYRHKRICPTKVESVCQNRER